MSPIIPDHGYEKQRVPWSKGEIDALVQSAERDAINPTTPGVYAIIIVTLISVIRQLQRELEHKDYSGD